MVFRRLGSLFLNAYLFSYGILNFKLAVSLGRTNSSVPLNFMKSILKCHGRLLTFLNNWCYNTFSTYEPVYSHRNFYFPFNFTRPRIHPIFSIQMHFTHKCSTRSTFEDSFLNLTVRFRRHLKISENYGGAKL